MVSWWWLLVAFGAGAVFTLVIWVVWMMRVGRSIDRATGWR